MFTLQCIGPDFGQFHSSCDCFCLHVQFIMIPQVKQRGMTRATATIDTGNSYRCHHQPIRGQYPGHVTGIGQSEASIQVTWLALANQRHGNSFPWPGPDHRSQTTDLFWSQKTANPDNILSHPWLSHYLRLGFCCLWNRGVIMIRRSYSFVHFV